jgi:Reverse transcriptase (RNA-dependent DNA polymerase)
MITSNLPAAFWGEAVHTAAKVRNRLPTSTLRGNISPYEAWFGYAPSLRHLRVFGCLAFYKLKHPKSKVLSRGVRCCLLGYDGNTQFRVYDPAKKKVVQNIRNIDFIETEFLDPSETATVPYADRPLLVPELRNYTDEDDEEVDLDDFPDSFWDDADNDESLDSDIPELVPDIVIPAPQYLPIPQAQQANPEISRRPQPKWPIPPTVYRAPDPTIGDQDLQTPSSPTPSYHTVPSQPASPVSSEHLSPHGSPTRSPQAPVTPAVRQSGRQRTETQKVRLNKEQAEEKLKAKGLVAHTGPTLHSSSPYYRATWAPPDEPRTLKAAMASPYSSYWTTAIEEELTSMLEHGSYTIVPRPHDRKVIGSKFAFKVKNAETTNPRFKARFVARGFTQVAHVDYEDTFAPVVKATSVRLVLSIAAGRRHLVNLFDVETAFLNSNIDREIYIEQPEGFEHPDCPRDQYVLMVNKGIYGLKQAGALYAKDQKSKLTDLGFTPSEADECVYISADKRIIVATYVDDGLVCAETQEEIDWVIAELSKHYKLHNLGSPTKFLGMDISRPQDDPRGPITVSQSTYARKLLAKFEMENCNPVKAPCDQRAAYLHLRTETEAPADAALYRSMTSSIMHLAIWTRPDIAWITNKLSQFNKDPSDLHMAAAKHLLRYIQGTLDYSFTYSPSIDNSLYGLFADYNDFDYTPLHGYSDASGASDPDDRCSTSGYIFFLNGAPIVWGSRKQVYAVALSTMEGEYLALTEAAKEAMFLRNLLISINIPQERPTLILTDSEAALKHVKNNVNHPRSKHIDTRHHYIRHVYNSGDVDIRHVPSASQTADILTKPLGILKHQDAVGLLRLHSR